MEVAPTREALDLKARALTDKFARVESELGQGPWFAGDAFGWLMRCSRRCFAISRTFDDIFDHRILAHKPKAVAWRAALLARPSVRNAVPADYHERLDRFIHAQDGALAMLMTSRARSSWRVAQRRAEAKRENSSRVVQKQVNPLT